MAAGFQYFDYNSSGAPVLTGAANRLIPVLDWALTGKGGWAKPFSGTSLAAYRANAGNRFYLRVDDTQALHARLRAHRAMTAINTGTSQFPTTAQMGGNLNDWGIKKAYAAGSDTKRYWGVRTDRYLVLVVEGPNLSDGSGVGYRNIMAFGDVPSLVEADAHNSILMGAAGQAGFPDITSAFNMGALQPQAVINASNSGLGISGTPSGAVVAPAAAAYWPFAGTSADQRPGLAQADRLTYAGVLIGSTPSSTAGNYPYPRARLPNVSVLWGPAADGVPDSQLPAVDLVPFTVGARTFLPILRYANGVGGYLVETLLLETTDTDGAL